MCLRGGTLGDVFKKSPRAQFIPRCILVWFTISWKAWKRDTAC